MTKVADRLCRRREACPAIGGIDPKRMLIAALVSLSLPASAFAAAPLRWSAPTVIDTQTPFSLRNAIVGISCPARSLCVAVDDAGNILSSTAPDRGAGAWTLTRGVDPGAELRSIACPSVTVCVAVDSAGGVISSSAPASGRWTSAAVADPSGDLRAISCPSRRLCVAVDGHGGALTSTNPTGGARTWRLHRALASGRALEAISCRSASLCVALGPAGIANSTDGGRRWRLSPYPPGTSVRSTDFMIACPSRALCVAGLAIAGKTTQVLSSARPSTPGSWHSRTVRLRDEGVFTSIACPSVSLCLAGNTAHDVAVGSPSGAWRVTPVGNPVINGYDDIVLSCPTTALCVGGDAAGLALSSTRPTGGTRAWNVVAVDQSNAIRGLSCTSATFCAVADSGGNVLTSSVPGGGRSAWTPVHLLEQDEGFASLTCIATPLCVAGATSAPVISASTRPTGGRAAWRRAQIGDEAVEINGISCPSPSLCVAVDSGVYTDSMLSSIDTSTNPTGGDRAWRSTVRDATFSDRAVLTGVSCPSTTLCVAVDDRGNVVTTNAPTGRKWTLTRRDGRRALAGVSCPSTALCVAVDRSGNVLTSTQPLAGPWRTARVDAGNELTAVSCASATLCVAVDAEGNVLSSRNPSGGTAAWTRQARVDPDLTSVSCSPDGFCLAGDDYGSVVTGTSA